MLRTWLHVKHANKRLLCMSWEITTKQITTKQNKLNCDLTFISRCMKRKNVWLNNTSEFSTNLYVPGHEINILHLFWPTLDRFNDRAAEGWTSFSSCRPPPLRRRPGPAETPSQTLRPICSLGLQAWTSAPNLQPSGQDAVTWWQKQSLRAEKIKWKQLRQLEHFIFLLSFFGGVVRGSYMWSCLQGGAHCGKQNHEKLSQIVCGTREFYSILETDSLTCQIQRFLNLFWFILHINLVLRAHRKLLGRGGPLS